MEQVKSHQRAGLYLQHWSTTCSLLRVGSKSGVIQSKAGSCLEPPKWVFWGSGAGRLSEENLGAREFFDVGLKILSFPTEQEESSLISLWFLRFVVSRLLGPLTGRDALFFSCLKHPQSRRIEGQETKKNMLWKGKALLLGHVLPIFRHIHGGVYQIPPLQISHLACIIKCSRFLYMLFWLKKKAMLSKAGLTKGRPYQQFLYCLMWSAWLPSQETPQNHENWSAKLGAHKNAYTVWTLEWFSGQFLLCPSHSLTYK